MTLELNRIYCGDCLKYLKNNTHNITWGRKKDINKQNLIGGTSLKASRKGHHLNVKSVEKSSGESPTRSLKAIIDFVENFVISSGNVARKKLSFTHPINKKRKTPIGVEEYAPKTHVSGAAKNLGNGANRFLKEIIGHAKNAEHGVPPDVTSGSKHITKNHLQYSQNYVLSSIMASLFVNNATLKNPKEMRSSYV